MPPAPARPPAQRAPSLWESILSDLHHLADNQHDAVAERAAAIRTITNVRLRLKVVRRITMPQQLQTTDWKTIVYDRKVPAALCSLYSRLAATQPTSLAAYIASEALLTFCILTYQQIKRQHELCTCDPARSGCCTSSSCAAATASGILWCRNNPLFLAMRSQMEQAGVFSSLGIMMTAAAEDARGEHGADHPAVVYQHACSTCFREAEHYPVLQHGRTLLHAWHLVWGMWGSTSGQVPLHNELAATPGVVRLSASILHVANRDLPTVAATAAPELVAPSNESSKAHVLYGTLHTALEMTVFVAETVTYYSMWKQPVEPLELPAGIKSELDAVLATMITLAAESLLLRQQGSLMAAASSSMIVTSCNSNLNSQSCLAASNTTYIKAEAAGSSRRSQGSRAGSGSNSASAGRTDCSAVVRRVNKACRDLPECIRALLQMQGVDSRAIVWAAAAVQGVAEHDTMFNLVVAYYACNRSASWTSEQHKQQQQQGLLISAVLLRWAARHSKTISTPQQAQQWAEIVSAAHEIWTATSQLPPTSPPLREVAGGSPWAQDQLPAQWVQLVVPNIHKSLRALLQLFRRAGNNLGSAPVTLITLWDTTAADSSALALPADTFPLVRDAVLGLNEMLCKLLQCAAVGRCAGAAVQSCVSAASTAGSVPEMVHGASSAGVAGQHASGNSSNTHEDRSSTKPTVSAAAAAATSAAHATSATGFPSGQLPGAIDQAAQCKPQHCSTQGPNVAEQATVSDMPCSATAFTPELPMALAAFSGVTTQIISSFENFFRFAAGELGVDSIDAKIEDALQSVLELLSDPQGYQSALGQHQDLLRHLEAYLPVLQSISEACARRVSTTDSSWTPGPLLALVQAAGPGSSEQRHIYSLLCSMMKLSRAYRFDFGPGADLSESVMAAAAMLLVPVSHTNAAGQHVDNITQAAAAEPSNSMQLCIDSAVPRVVAAAQQPLVPPSVANMQHVSGTALPALLQVPGLALLGRCCLHWAQPWQPWSPCLVAPGSERDTDMLPDMMLTPVLDWLRMPLHTEQLGAAGYRVQQLVPLLQGLQKAHAASLRQVKHTDAAAAELQQLLRAAGDALTRLPANRMCNNPACSNVTGPAELQLVTGSSHQCGGCRTARYCSKACQLKHWKRHKPVCKARATAVSAAAAEQLGS